MSFIVDIFCCVSPLISRYDKLARIGFVEKFLTGMRP